MLTRIQTKHYRSLKRVDQPLGPFHALVGPNASGKTTFLDVIAFLSDLMRNQGELLAVSKKRSSTFQDLLWCGKGHEFQLAVEARLPPDVRALLSQDHETATTIRYEIGVGIDPFKNTIEFNHETVLLIEGKAEAVPSPRDFFPEWHSDIDSVYLAAGKQNRKTLINKTPNGNDNFYPEGKKTYKPSFRLGPQRSALANLPADDVSFPALTWFKTLLRSGVESLMLNSQILRMPGAPGAGKTLGPDGSNLPWVVHELQKKKQSFRRWLDHVKTALKDIEDITSVERTDDRHRYLVVKYANGTKVPSWLLSDGTLRLLALTIPAYIEGFAGIYLIEEPENGIHPRAIETAIESLSSIYNGQVLIATHSPVALGILEPSQILCFGKDYEGATDIASGDTHPALRDWKRGNPDIGSIFAAGVLS